MTIPEKKKHLREYRLHQMRILRLTEASQKYPNEAPQRHREIENTWKIIEKIESEIATVDDLLLREILEQKYIYGYTLGEIATSTNYSKRQIERLHAKALNLLEIAS